MAAGNSQATVDAYTQGRLTHRYFEPAPQASSLGAE